MDTTGRKASTATQGVSLKRGLMKVLVGILAVPAVCALVVVGGAVPIYLLLPDAPTAPAQQQAKAKPEAGAMDAPVRVATASAAVAKDSAAVPRESATPPSGPAGATGPDVVEDTIPAEDMDPEPAVAAETAVVPTPRPAPVVANSAATGEGADRPVEHLASKQDAAAVPSQPVQSVARAFQAQRRSVTIRPVALRAGPGGRAVAQLGRGAEVLVGRCDDWCEVRSGAAQGWLHPSFLADAAAGTARPPVRRDIRRAPEPQEVYRPIESPRQVRRWRDDPAARREADDGWLADDRDPIDYYGYE